MADFDQELAFAHELADLADRITLPLFQSGLVVETKADGTAVTAADRSAERAMRAAIRERFPDHAILGEEDGREGPEDAPTWILDPIDGTANFVAGVPVFGTLVGLEIDGAAVVGVVSAPAMGVRWDGSLGGGARRDGVAIAVSDTVALSAAAVSFGGLRYFDLHGWPRLVADLTAATARQRGFGDFWQHMLVASGAIDAALEGEVSHWDLVAVRCIVEAAGGTFTSLAGEATSRGGSALSSNGHVHAAVLAVAGGNGA